jgi:Fe-Mn family superoxide dismutase
MQHEAKNFDHLIGQLKGISEPQLKAHFGLYQGYVKKLNEIEDKLASADPKAANYSFNEYSELKRREAVAFNGSYLHQLYFENLAAPGQNANANFKAAAEKSFGSWDRWLADVRGCATSTPGWVVTTLNKVDHKVHNYVMFEHHLHLPVHQEIVMALDCWEHAYMVDYSTAKAKYLDAFMENINWQAVGSRFDKATAGA